jgi:prepilin-type N-terminal cleavage/methylation domain-containing protein
MARRPRSEVHISQPFSCPNVPRACEPGFSLVELLVVITIIVLLLALLAPALEKAIYEAELAMCGAQLKGMGQGVTAYAMDHKRLYPQRPAMDADNGNYMPTAFSLPFGVHNRHTPEGFDMRPILKPYFPLKLLQCPPAIQNIDFEASHPDTMVFSSYAMWYGWIYKDQPGTKMARLGDGLGYKNKTYHVLAGDWFSVLVAFGTGLQIAHNDRQGTLSHFQRQDQTWTALPADIKATVSFHDGPAGNNIGAFDIDFVFDDLSVRRFGEVYWNTAHSIARDDPRLDAVPWAHGGNTDDNGGGTFTAIPATR